MDAQNGLTGDFTGIELPQMVPDDDILKDERKMAKYSRSAEFKRITDHFNERIEFYQKYLPGGAEVGLDVRPTTEDWAVANRVIGEFKLVINMYETAKEAVDNATPRL